MNEKERMLLWADTLLEQISRLEQGSGMEICRACGEACARTSELVKGAGEIRKTCGEDADPDILFDAFQKQFAHEAVLRKSGDYLILEFTRCTCPLVKAGVRHPYLCHCTAGYSQALFRALFGRPVEVELEQSILQGDERCRQRIRIA